MTQSPKPDGGGAGSAWPAKLLRYGQAMVGPVGVAGSQFLLAVLLLQSLGPAEFGAFSFLLISFQFASGLWSALFCAPLPAALAGQGVEDRDRVLAAIFGANLLLALLAAALFVAIAALLDLSWPAAFLFAAYAGVGLVRWFARAHAYVDAAPLRATASDAIHGAVVLAGCGAMWASGVVTMAGASGALLAAAVLGLLPFAFRPLLRTLAAAGPSRFGAYRDVWRRHSRWSLVGVISTEATVNAHAYVVTLLSGPAAFAPLAASALLLRPISVVMNALTEFERPNMARQIAGAGGVAAALRSALLFRLALIAAWTVNALAAALLLSYAPSLMFPAKYPLDLIVMGSALWLAVGLVRVGRLPESALLQAAGRFKPLAYASVWSSFVSVGAVVALVLLSGPLWSILGVMLGELVFAGFLWRAARIWTREALRPV